MFHSFTDKSTTLVMEEEDTIVEDADEEVDIMNNDDGEPPIQEGDGVFNRERGEVDVPPIISQVVPTSRIAADFRSSSLGSRKGGLKGIFKKTVSNKNPLKRMKKNGPNSPGFVNLSKDNTHDDEGCVFSSG